MPGCREIVQHEENGLLVSPRDPMQLAAAITRLAEDPAARARMGAAGRRLVVAELSEERVVAQTMELYRRLLQGSSPASAWA
jgi:glycosyltransferase involved in cell wall biosynthesis